MSGVDSRVAATMREPGGVAGGAAKERGTTPSKPKKVDVTHRRDSCKGRTPAGNHEYNNNTDLGSPLGDHAKKGTTIAAQLGSSIDACKKKTPAKGGQGGGTRRPLPKKSAGGDRAENNAAPIRTKTAPGFWPARQQNPHLWNERLQKAKVEMLNKLARMRKADLKEWSSDSDDDGQMTPIQLSTEHRKFLNGLPDYLSYGEGRSSTYFCPCSPVMKDWRRGINMEDWGGNVRPGLVPLLDHCRSLGDVYHLSFSEYARRVTGGVQRPRPRSGRGAASATDGTNAQPRQPSPSAARANDARAQHE